MAITLILPVLLFYRPDDNSSPSVLNPAGNSGILMDPRISVLVWDDSWRSRKGRIMPVAEDWQQLFDAMIESGVRILVIADEKVFSRYRVAEPGYVDAFQTAKDAGLEIYGPVRFSVPGESYRGSLSALVGMQIESFVMDGIPGDSGGHPGSGVTTTRNLEAIPKLAPDGLIGPAPEFLGALAGVGAMSSDPQSFVPLYRWREDRLIPDLALAPRRPGFGAYLNRGVVFAGKKPLAVGNGGQVSFPLATGFAWYTGNMDAVSGFKGVETIIVGESGSSFLNRVAIIANAAIQGKLPQRQDWRVLASFMVAAIAGALLARIPSIGLALALATGVILISWLLFTSGPGRELSSGPLYRGAFAAGAYWKLMIAFYAPFGAELIRRAIRRDRRIQEVAKKMARFEMEKMAMGRQARMLVHDLRRLIQPEGVPAASYLEGFLAEFAALDGSGRELCIESLSAVTLIKSQISQASHLLESHQLKISLRWRHRSRLAVDPVNAKRIMDNLIANAAAASPPGRVIRISTDEKFIESERGKACCCIIQIENEVAGPVDGSVFAALEDGRVRSSTKKRESLGLVIVHRLVAAIGGRVSGEILRPEDSAAAAVAVVVVVLPVDQMLPDMNVLRSKEPSYQLASCDAGAVQNESWSDIAPENHSPSEFRPVLVVDDSPFVRDFWECQSGHYDLYCFKSPEDVLAMVRSNQDLRERRPVVIMDYHFDGSSLDGVQAARLLQELGIHDIVLSSDWDLGSLELKGIAVPVIKKSEATIDSVVSLLAGAERGTS